MADSAPAPPADAVAPAVSEAAAPAPASAERLVLLAKLKKQSAFFVLLLFSRSSLHTTHRPSLTPARRPLRPSNPNP